MADRMQYTVGGNVNPNDPFYVARNADTELQTLCEAGEFAYVLSSRQVGKSSLMVRTSQALEEKGVKTVQIDLNEVGVNLSAEEWYFGLLFRIHKSLGLEAEILDWWQEQSQIGFVQRLFEYFDDVLLAEIETPVVIFIDEIDTTLRMDFTDDFFATIRALYNRRSENSEYQRLSFVLVGVATPSELIKDHRRTPFNIGKRVEVTDFSYDEALPLAAGFDREQEDGRDILRWILKWTGGHPYLTQKTCATIARELPENRNRRFSENDVDRLVGRTFFGKMSTQDDNLQYVQNWITADASDQSEIMEAYKAIRLGKKPYEDDEQSQTLTRLKLSGIVRRDGTSLIVRNPIYKIVFDRKWIDKHWPDKFLTPTVVKRAKYAFAALVISLIVALGFVAYFFLEQSRQAKLAEDAQAKRAEVEAEKAQTALDGQRVADSLKIEESRQKAVALRQAAISDSLKNEETLARLAEAEARKEAERNEALAADSAQAAAAARDIATQRQFALQRTTNGVFARDIALQAITLQRQGGRDTLAALLAKRAHTLNKRSPGFFINEVYNALRVTLNSPEISGDQRLGGPKTLAAHEDWAMSIAISPDGQTFASGGADSTIRVWRIDNPTQPETVGKQMGSVRVLTFSPDGGKIVSGGDDLSVLVWDLANRKAGPTRLTGHTGWVWAITFSPDGSLLATAGADSTIRLWNAEAELIQIDSLKSHRASVHAVKFSDNGQAMISCGLDSLVLLWNLEKLQSGPIVLPNPSSMLRDIDFSATGAIAAAGADGNVWLWNLKKGLQEAVALRGHAGGVNSVDFNPDGTMLASGGEDGTVRLWNIRNTQINPIVLDDNAAWIWDVTFGKDGKTVISGSSDKKIRFWTTAPESLATQIERIVKRQLTPEEKQEFLAPITPQQSGE